ncbi:MAG: Crp/Fnr family transcriptional regulator [Bacteroidota bacterium]
MDYHDFLNTYHPISRQDYELIAESLTPRTAKRNELIAAEGDITRELYFVYEGTQISCYNHDGTERVMSFHYPQSLMGLPDSFYNQQPTRYYIRALTDSRYGAISFKRLEELYDESQAIERLFRKMTEAKFCGLVTRHTEFHTCTIEERFKNFASRSPQLLQLVPHKYIASYLNIDATNFSKLYNSIRV